MERIPESGIERAKPTVEFRVLLFVESLRYSLLESLGIDCTDFEEFGQSRGVGMRDEASLEEMIPESGINRCDLIRVRREKSPGKRLHKVLERFEHCALIVPDNH